MEPPIEVKVELDIEDPAQAEQILAEVVRQIEAGQTSGFIYGYEWELDDTLELPETEPDVSSSTV